MTEHFCTCFDDRYLPRGLAMWQSLRAVRPDAVLHVLCLSDACFAILGSLNLPDVQLYALPNLERDDPELASTRTTRTRVEYYFTLTPSVPLMVLRNHADVSRVTYLDADLFFLSDPQPVFDELGDASIGVVEHRFPDGVDREAHGRFNVGWLTFRRDAEAMRCLTRWRAQCIEWCRDRAESGRFADQKYLDPWPAMFSGVHIIAHRGANLAPWNLNRFSLAEVAGTLTVDRQPLIFFHAHGFKPASPVSQRNLNLSAYGARLHPFVLRCIFKPYEDALERVTERVALPLVSALLAENVRQEARLLTSMNVGGLPFSVNPEGLAALLSEAQGRLDSSEADRAARLAIIEELHQRLGEVEADRSERLVLIQGLRQQLMVAEAERSARLDLVQRLQRQLDESESDRTARLKVIEELRQQLATSEADREARLHSIEALLEQQEAGEAARQGALQTQCDEMNALHGSLDAAVRARDDARTRVAALEGSRSWRWSAPIRRVIDAFASPRAVQRSARLSATVAPADSDIRGWVDAPEEGTPLPTRVVVRGWCYHCSGAPITHVRVRSGVRRFRGAYGESRPDVVEAFTGAPVPPDCGYQVPVVLASRARQLDVQAKVEGGDWCTVDMISLEPSCAPVPRAGARWPRFWFNAWTGRPHDWPLLSTAELDYAVAQVRVHGLLSLSPSPQYPPRPLAFERLPHGARSASELPRIVVVTPSYGQAAYLEDAIRSVLDQEGVRISYVVEDGGSTDGSAEIIRKYSGRLAGWESAPDDGQAAAIVRGFSRVKPSAGDLMMYLNSDDLLVPGAARFVADYFAQHPEVDVVYGHRLMTDDRGREVGRWVTPRTACDDYMVHDFIPQETLFWRRRIWDRVGGIDTTFAFALDWDLILRFHEAGARFARLPWFLGCFRLHPAQKTAIRVDQDGIPEMDRLRLRSLGRLPSKDELHRAMCKAQVDSALVSEMLRWGVRV